MKNARQNLILEIIGNENIETQEELSDHLAKAGIRVTQATVSRDIKELRLMKVLSSNGKYCYATTERAQHDLSERYTRILAESIVSMECAANLMVVRTLTGSANAAGEAVDAMKLPEVLGTIAGDNTLLVIGRSEESIMAVRERFNKLVQTRAKR